MIVQVVVTDLVSEIVPAVENAPVVGIDPASVTALAVEIALAPVIVQVVVTDPASEIAPD